MTKFVSITSFTAAIMGVLIACGGGRALPQTASNDAVIAETNDDDDGAPLTRKGCSPQVYCWKNGKKTSNNTFCGSSDMAKQCRDGGGTTAGANGPPAPPPPPPPPP